MSKIEFAEAMPNTATRAERFAAGKALRAKAPRTGHGEWSLLLIVLIRLVCLRSRVAPAYRNWYPYAMDACHCHHLRSYAARR